VAAVVGRCRMRRSRNDRPSEWEGVARLAWSVASAMAVRGGSHPAAVDAGSESGSRAWSCADARGGDRARRVRPTWRAADSRAAPCSAR
jgi:hypothetical protein